MKFGHFNRGGGPVMGATGQAELAREVWQQHWQSPLRLASGARWYYLVLNLLPTDAFIVNFLLNESIPTPISRNRTPGGLF